MYTIMHAIFDTLVSVVDNRTSLIAVVEVVHDIWIDCHKRMIRIDALVLEFLCSTAVIPRHLTSVFWSVDGNLDFVQ
jgi:hypothetical protein